MSYFLLNKSLASREGHTNSSSTTLTRTQLFLPYNLCWSNVNMHESIWLFWERETESNALNVTGLIAAAFNWTKPQKRLGQLRRGSSCHPVSPSVIYTVTASCGRHPKATYCEKDINLSHQLIIFLISWPRIPSQGKERARVSLGQTRNPPLALKNNQPWVVNMVEMSMNVNVLVCIIERLSQQSFK